VVLADLDRTAAGQEAAKLTSDGYQAIGVGVDVTDLASAQSMAAAAVDAFGGVDVLINNAAIMTDLPQYTLADMPVSEWDRVSTSTSGARSSAPKLCSSR
jgi:NAD(P)-dependent dehydrogenase (short-subunit alcohol dehydrogenase family)